jgi:hypothetical protein
MKFTTTYTSDEGGRFNPNKTKRQLEGGRKDYKI